MPSTETSNGEATPRSSSRLRLKSLKVHSEDEESQGAAGMSLDVLAQVASETLENEPHTSKKSGKKKLSLRNIQSLEVLHLEQIQELTERSIIRLFSEVTSNELSRKFTYTCHLMPKQCQQSFSSFGSDMRSKADLRKHLYKHLADLAVEENAPGKKTKFTAEPVHVRKKRMLNAVLPPKRKKGRPRNFDEIQKICDEQTNIPPKVYVDNDFTNLKEGINDAEMEAINDGIETYLQNKKLQEVDNEQASLLSKTVTVQMSPIGRHRIPKHNYWPTVKGLKKSSKSDGNSSESPDKHIDSGSDNETERKIEENEQFIIDLLAKTQPHHDHSYTTIFGKRKGSEMVHHLQDSDDEGQEEKEIDVGDNVVVFVDCAGKTKKKTDTHPILFLRHRSPNENVPMVSMEEIIDDKKDLPDSDAEPDEDGAVVHSGEKPYPPMPKSVLAQRGRIDIPEDISDEEEYLRKRKRSLNPLGREGREGGLGWEPKLALKYIRELKTRKRDENVSLKCRICKDKSFTAMATLMYHYRSHAGIKPFVCLICNTTFTRQHSLNYHMLIHNNQSRFTCKDCGRKFRHPSHFKEHLRRHTGETPFECLDCSQRFKTRNTYKRHLKTRHGKLLTASGIHMLSKEEFMKVRTKPYKIPLRPYMRQPKSTAELLAKVRSSEKYKLCESSVDVDLTEIDVVNVKQEPGIAASREQSGSNPVMTILAQDTDRFITKLVERRVKIGTEKVKLVKESMDKNQVILHVIK